MSKGYYTAADIRKDGRLKAKKLKEREEMTNKKPKLIPADKTRCQADVSTWNPWHIAGRDVKVERCKSKPTFIAKENKAGQDGRKGTMSVCRPCRRELERQLGKNYATFEPIQPKKPKGTK